MPSDNFQTVTELPNTEISSIQLKRSFQRYFFAKSFHKNGKLIEIGCGGGQGLNLYLNPNTEIIGYDINQKNIDICKHSYNNEKGISFFKEDVEKLNFKPNSIATVLIFETVYYLKNTEKFFQMLHDSLKPKGKIIICSANKDWHSFNPSPFSTKYLSLKELHDLGKQCSFEVETFVSFPDKSSTVFDKIIKTIKRIAVKFRLIPKTMKGKLLLKKIFSGKMCLMPEKFTNDTDDYIPPTKTISLEKDIYSTAIFAVYTKK